MSYMYMYSECSLPRTEHPHRLTRGRTKEPPGARVGGMVRVDPFDVGGRLQDAQVTGQPMAT